MCNKSTITTRPATTLQQPSPSSPILFSSADSLSTPREQPTTSTELLISWVTTWEVAGQALREWLSGLGTWNKSYGRRLYFMGLTYGICLPMVTPPLLRQATLREMMPHPLYNAPKAVGCKTEGDEGDAGTHHVEKKEDGEAQRQEDPVLPSVPERPATWRRLRQQFGPVLNNGQAARATPGESCDQESQLTHRRGMRQGHQLTEHLEDPKLTPPSPR